MIISKVFVKHHAPQLYAVTVLEPVHLIGQLGGFVIGHWLTERFQW